MIASSIVRIIIPDKLSIYCYLFFFFLPTIILSVSIFHQYSSQYRNVSGWYRNANDERRRRLIIMVLPRDQVPRRPRDESHDVLAVIHFGWIPKNENIEFETAYSNNNNYNIKKYVIYCFFVQKIKIIL